jgi:hypothetical protein
LVVTQLFDLNARIQQLTWSLIFYEKYSTSLLTIVLVVFTTANFGGLSNFCRYYTQSQTGKSTGPLWNPCIVAIFDAVQIFYLPEFLGGGLPVESLSVYSIVSVSELPSNPSVDIPLVTWFPCSNWIKK